MLDLKDSEYLILFTLNNGIKIQQSLKGFKKNCFWKFKKKFNLSNKDNYHASKISCNESSRAILL